MKRSALPALFLVAACGSIGTAQAQTVALAYKAGDTYRYAFHMVLKYNVGAQGMSIPLDLDLTAKETITVKSVDSSGTADVAVEVTNLSMKMSANGTSNTTTTTNTTTVDMKIASDGRVISVIGNAFGNRTFPGATGSQGGLVSAILPDKPVKPGDTWSKSYTEPSPLGTGSIQVTSDNKYLRDEKVGSTSTAVVESKINEALNISIDASSMTGGGASMLPATGAGGGIQSLTIQGTSPSDVTSWIDTGAKRLVKTHSTGTVDATLTLNMSAGATMPGMTGPITFKGTQTMDLTPA